MLQNWIGSKVMVAKNFETRCANVLKHEDAKARRHKGIETLKREVFETQRREGTKTRSFFYKTLKVVNDMCC